MGNMYLPVINLWHSFQISSEPVPWKWSGRREGKAEMLEWRRGSNRDLEYHVLVGTGTGMGQRASARISILMKRTKASNSLFSKDGWTQ